MGAPDFGLRMEFLREMNFFTGGTASDQRGGGCAKGYRSVSNEDAQLCCKQTITLCFCIHPLERSAKYKQVVAAQLESSGFHEFQAAVRKE
jgi:hypothetical protein